MQRALILLAIIALFIGLSAKLVAEEKSSATKIIKADSILSVSLEGVIHGGTVELLESAIKKVERSHTALLIELDTPGGLLESTREIVKLFLNSDVPIIVYVAPSGSRAGSAGTFLTLAAHIAAMAPGTNIGAAHPITISGKDPEEEGGKHLAKKIENDTLAFVETIAKQRDRNIEWAKKAVKESSSITEEKALELGVIDIVARDSQSLLKKIDGLEFKMQGKKVTFQTTEATVEKLEIPVSLQVLNFLASPTTMFLLIIVFVLGLYIEFSSPGMIVPAVASLVALILLGFASRVLPISYLGLLLMLCGVVLLIVEIYVTSFGLLTVGGLACFFFGGLLLFDPSKTDVRIPLTYLISATAGVAAIALVVGYLLIKSLNLPDTAGKEELIGKTGEAAGDVEKATNFRIFLHGEYWSAESDSPVTLKKGEKVLVESINGLKVKVKKSSEV